MAYSREYKRECYYDFMSENDDNPMIKKPTHEDLKSLGRLIDPFVEGFDGNGLIWKNRTRENCFGHMDLNLETVYRVCCLLSHIYSVYGIIGFDDLKKKSTRIRGSYGLKHDMERIRIRKGDTNEYVSNGEFIGAYLYLLREYYGATDRQISSMVKPTNGLNLWMKIPVGFIYIEQFCGNGIKTSMTNIDLPMFSVNVK